VCHQTVCLIARHLEAAGTPTVSLTSAYDITSAGKPPRALFVDYPLGHTCGRPFDAKDQYEIVRAGLTGLEAIEEPGAIVDLGRHWSDDDGWKAAAMASEGGDTRSSRDTTPQWQHPDDRVAASGSDTSGDGSLRS